jgi:hypothetical protein
MGGIAVVRHSSNLVDCWSHMTSVTMRPMEDSAIRQYVATGEPLDKAGAYAIQGIGLQFVDRIEWLILECGGAQHRHSTRKAAQAWSAMTIAERLDHVLLSLRSGGGTFALELEATCSSSP